MSETIVRTSKIEIDVALDKDNVPEEMVWSAEDGKINREKTTGMFLAMWDKRSQNTMKIDLWTKEMTVDEMKVFFHQTLVSMADAFERATNEKNIVDDLKDYCEHFADKMNIEKK
ncbi:MAG: gliding motility protein GldC [Crocinitomicaceae bacterium]